MALVSFYNTWKYHLWFSDIFRGYRKRPAPWNGPLSDNHIISTTLLSPFTLASWQQKNRSSCLQMFFKIGVLKNFVIFKRKHLRRSLFLIKLQAIRLQKRLEHMYFPVNIAKFLRTAFVIEHLWCLFLKRTPSLSYLFIISIIDKLLYSNSHLLVGKTYLNTEDEWFMIFQLIRWTCW